ncbi:Elongator complex protein 6 [Geodia barretti]|uniref:Elongator complex protein 6 n=1 Tax=Geodia barretti TaxID=519541 RepID=A0AA35SE21_GEOBA|nr:Elongator complex protein 6 [Geodia barretti]
MLNEVASFLERKEKDDLMLVLVSDRQANGSFLIHYFISQALKDGFDVYLVSFAQSFIHYSSVASKLGVNLSRYQSSGQLVYIDCLSRLLDGIWAEPGDALVATPPNKSPSTVTYSLDSDGTLRGLYDEIQSLLTCGRTQKPVCIVLDDLSILTSVGVRCIANVR